MSPNIQTLLFATYAFFYLMPGDALQCRNCSYEPPSKTCGPDMVCEIDPETGACRLTKYYKDGKLFKIRQNCWTTKNSCDVEIEFPGIDMHAEIKCCDDRDFCNEA